MNRALINGHIPAEASEGTMILLPKISKWNGQIDKTRPITLLDTHRKIFEGILATRIIEIIETNDLLKGPNYGFRKGASTMEPIFIINTLIDIYKHQKKTLFIAKLDVQAAFDSVPFRGLKKGLERIHAPLKLIQLLETNGQQQSTTNTNSTRNY